MKVSILMSIYNREQYISECLCSILGQSMQDFEIVIVDDGSTDHTAKIIKCFSDPRIRLIEKDHNFIESLNVGLKECQGEYIARMDGDDIMDPDRLKKQVEIMDYMTDISICGSWMRSFGIQNTEIKNYNGLIKEPLVQLLLGNIISNPSTIIRKSFLRSNNIEYKNYLWAEDYYFWVDCAKNNGRFWIIPEFLMNYRCSFTQVSYLHSEEQEDISDNIKSEILLILLNSPKYSKDIYKDLYQKTQILNEMGLLSSEIIYNIFYDIFTHDYYANNKI